RYRNPPAQHQFQPGCSGNARGRPKGSRNLKTDLAALLDGKVEITVNGQRRRMTRQEALLLNLFHRSVGKDTKAAKTLLDLVLKLQPPDAKPEKAKPTASDNAIIENFLRRNDYVKAGGSNV